MTTIIDVYDPDVIKQLAMAKARGRTWQIIGEKNNIPANVLDYLPWHLPKEWANACKYAEKLVAHEALAETLAELRLQMKDPTLPARLKTQVSNSIVRIIQQQHALRTPKQPKKATRQPLKPIEQPAPEPPAPIVNEPVVAPPLADTPKPMASATPLGTVAAMLLFVLLGMFGLVRGLMAMDRETRATTAVVGWAASPTPHQSLQPDALMSCCQRKVLPNSVQQHADATISEHGLPPPESRRLTRHTRCSYHRRKPVTTDSRPWQMSTKA